MKIDGYVHTPVLLEEVLHGIEVRTDGIYVDCTFGRGGHSRAILERLGSTGKLFAFDKDPEAIRYARDMASSEPRLQFYHRSFAGLFDTLNQAGVAGRIDGILFDLGVSSPQLEDADRGFSFSRDGGLDMRMDPGSGTSAADWINHASQDEITHVLKVYGEEKFARRIARAIVETRTSRAFTRTGELAEVIVAAIPARERNKHPATRSFQAIRIFINHELEELTAGLDQAFKLLRVNGRLLVISFHSLEDRIVKRFMREHAKGDPYPQDIPVTAGQLRPRMRIVGKAIKPGPAELSVNPRSRSAVLRIGEKLAV
jgi:16S rRNA (cytosine1402-N4)-methyltransferase